MGPPLSPWHESLPPVLIPAHHMLVVISPVLYCFLQVSRETTGTSTLRRAVGMELLPEEVVPLVQC
jgi:hypothetical protein